MAFNNTLTDRIQSFSRSIGTATLLSIATLIPSYGQDQTVIEEFQKQVSQVIQPATSLEQKTEIFGNWAAMVSQPDNGVDLFAIYEQLPKSTQLSLLNAMATDYVDNTEGPGRHLLRSIATTIRDDKITELIEKKHGITLITTAINEPEIRSGRAGTVLYTYGSQGVVPTFVDDPAFQHLEATGGYVGWTRLTGQAVPFPLKGNIFNNFFNDGRIAADQLFALERGRGVENVGYLGLALRRPQNDLESLFLSFAGTFSHGETDRGIGDVNNPTPGAAVRDIHDFLMNASWRTANPNAVVPATEQDIWAIQIASNRKFEQPDYGAFTGPETRRHKEFDLLFRTALDTNVFGQATERLELRAGMTASNLKVGHNIIRNPVFLGSITPNDVLGTPRAHDAQWYRLGVGLIQYPDRNDPTISVPDETGVRLTLFFGDNLGDYSAGGISGSGEIAVHAIDAGRRYDLSYRRMEFSPRLFTLEYPSELFGIPPLGNFQELYTAHRKEQLMRAGITNFHENGMPKQTYSAFYGWNVANSNLLVIGPAVLGGVFDIDQTQQLWEDRWGLQIELGEDDGSTWGTFFEKVKYGTLQRDGVPGKKDGETIGVFKGWRF